MKVGSDEINNCFVASEEINNGFAGSIEVFTAIQFIDYQSAIIQHVHTDANCYGQVQCTSPMRGTPGSYSFTCECGSSWTVSTTNWACGLGHYNGTSWYHVCTCGHVRDYRTSCPSHCGHSSRQLTCSLSNIGEVSMNYTKQTKSLDAVTSLSGSTITGYNWTCDTNKGQHLDLGTESHIVPKYRGTYSCKFTYRDDKTSATGTITATGTTK